jgi:hypothetical protein
MRARIHLPSRESPDRVCLGVLTVAKSRSKPVRLALVRLFLTAVFLTHCFNRGHKMNRRVPGLLTVI